MSVLGLGCNNLGFSTSKRRRRSSIKALDSGSRSSTRRTLRRARGLGKAARPDPRDRRKDIVLATKFGLAMDDAGRRSAGRAATSWRQWRRACGASGPTGSILSVSPARSEDSDRGDIARARRSGAAGQGSLNRLLDPAGLAGRRGAVDGAASRLAPLHFVPGGIQSARPRSRPRDDAGSGGL